MTVQETRQSVQSILNPGRMLSDGIPYPDFRRATELGDLEEWFDFWAETGERYEALGEEALAAGRRLSAGEWLWLASLSFHYAQFMWFHDPGRREQGQRRKVELYNRAAPHLRPPAERIEIAFEGATIPGFLRLPEGERPASGWPCALLLGGLESTKEESCLFESMCLRRGLATFAFDGPGQGEMFFEVKLRPDFERYASAVLDRLEGRPELDAGRFGVLGRSLGGFYALRSAAQEGRLRAAVSWGGFHDMSDFETMPPHTQRGFVYVTGIADREEAKAYLMEALRLDDVIGKLRVPAYVLHGRHDVIFSMRQLERLEAGLASAPAEIALEEDGDHCCHNMGQIVRPRMADWLAERLGATP